MGAIIVAASIVFGVAMNAQREEVNF